MPRKWRTLTILLLFISVSEHLGILQIRWGCSHEKGQKFLIGLQNPCSKDDFCIEINSWKIAWFCKFRTDTSISYRKRKFQLPKVTLEHVQSLHLTSFTYFNRKLNKQLLHRENRSVLTEIPLKKPTSITNTYTDWNFHNFQTWICNITLFVCNNGPAPVLWKEMQNHIFLRQNFPGG